MVELVRIQANSDTRVERIKGAPVLRLRDELLPIVHLSQLLGIKAVEENEKVEDGFLGGKGTEVHKATVVGDTVGDPFKDTAGPALNPMIKVMNLVGILIAPFTSIGIAFSWGRVSITVFSIAMLAIAVMLSKRGSIAEEQSQAGQSKAAA